jgi:SAM-dependent methyltransferase
VGAFEEMYRHEDTEHYDSWDQDDLSGLDVHLALAILARRRYATLLDLGCGKGAFTCAVAEFAHRIVAIDTSPTAVQKARARDPRIDFRVADVAAFAAGCHETFDLVVIRDVLSYIEAWPELIRLIARIGRSLFLSLSLPPDPIGFVKSFDDLRSVVARDFTVETDVMLDRKRLMVIATAVMR